MGESILTLTSADGRSVRLSIPELREALALREDPASTAAESFVDLADRVLSWSVDSSSIDWTPPPVPLPTIDDGAPRNRRERRRMAKTGSRDGGVSPNVAKR